MELELSQDSKFRHKAFKNKKIKSTNQNNAYRPGSQATTKSENKNTFYQTTVACVNW